MTDTVTNTQAIENHTDLTFTDGTGVTIESRSDCTTADLLVTSPAGQPIEMTRDDLDQLIDALRSAYGLVVIARKAAIERGEL